MTNTPPLTDEQLKTARIDLGKEFESESGLKSIQAVVSHGELGFASWEYQVWLENKVIELRTLTSAQGVKKHMKASQTFVEELKQYGITDDVGYINRAMQAYAQQFIDEQLKYQAQGVKIDLGEVERLVEHFVKTMFVTDTAREKVATELRKSIGYTLTDLTATTASGISVESNWISVDERLPEDLEQCYLVCIIVGSSPNPQVSRYPCYYNKKFNYWSPIDSPLPMEGVTHWGDFPPPPSNTVHRK